MSSFPAGGVLQSIAAENNLAETASLLPQGVCAHPQPRCYPVALILLEQAKTRETFAAGGNRFFVGARFPA